MDLLLGYLAGLLTMINPCVLPVLPIVMASAIQSGRYGTLAMTSGLCTSFVGTGMLLATIGHGIGLSQSVLERSGAILMMIFGLVLLIRQLDQKFALLASSFSALADNRLRQLSMTGVHSQFIGGLLLGAVWSPCVGPTLGGAISLASQGQELVKAFLVMLSFGLGVSSIVMLLAHGASGVIRRRQQRLSGVASRAKPVMGFIFATVGLIIFLKIHHLLEAWLVSVLPEWFQDLSILI